MDRYIRQTMLPEIGDEGQRRLSQSSVLIIGLGGLGSPVALYLAAAGIGSLGLTDLDTVSLSNLQRQILYDSSQVDRPKVDCARERLTSMAAPDCSVSTYPGGFTPENAIGLISEYDVVVDCTDNFASRILIDKTCAVLGKPWVYGSIDGFIGQVTVFGHTNGKRYVDLYPDAPRLASQPGRVIGTIGPLPGIVGSLQAAEAMKIITGIGDTLDGRLLVIDILNTDFNILNF